MLTAGVSEKVKEIQEIFSHGGFWQAYELNCAKNGKQTWKGASSCI